MKITEPSISVFIGSLKRSRFQNLIISRKIRFTKFIVTQFHQTLNDKHVIYQNFLHQIKTQYFFKKMMLVEKSLRISETQKTSGNI